MSVLDLFFPPRCMACGELLPEATPLCGTCRTGLIAVPEPACQGCGLPLAGPQAGSVKKCERCRAEPPAFARAVGAFAFAGAVAEAIPRFKYQDRPFLAEALIELAWPALGPHAQAAEVLAPIPLHRERLRERGFDQAYLLAEALGRRAGRPVEARLLERVRPTATQVGQAARERTENLRGAFAARAEAVRGRRVALVDDVITTTATAREAAEALRQAGAAEVVVLAVARAF